MADLVQEPIMNVAPDDIPGNIALANNILNGGAYDHILDFPHITVVKADYEQLAGDTTNFYTHRKGNTNNLEEAVAHNKLLHEDTKKILEYVLPICRGNITLIHNSGFPSNCGTTPHSLIDKVVIKKIEAGTDEQTVKIYIEKLTGDAKSIKASKTYIVRVYDDPELNVFHVGCITSDSAKLIVRDVTLMKSQWYAIIVSNSAGMNEISAKRKFTLANND